MYHTFQLQLEVLREELEKYEERLSIENLRDHVLLAAILKRDFVKTERDGASSSSLSLQQLAVI